MITETDRLSSALEVAAEVWPEIAGEKGLLLRRILERGIDEVEKAGQGRVASRRVAIETLAGSMTGVWPPGWRKQLRDESPA